MRVQTLLTALVFSASFVDVAFARGNGKNGFKHGNKNKGQASGVSSSTAAAAATGSATDSATDSAAATDSATATTDTASATVASASATDAGAAGGNNNANAAGGGGGGGALALNPQAVQTGSAQDGQSGTVEAGQARSTTDNANFINFCVDKSSFKGILTNGKQVKGGSCNGVVMGDIPAFQRQTVVSTIILNPKPGDVIAADQTFDIQIKIEGLETGSFTNPANTYYAAPQALNNGKIVGHTHVTCQDLGGTLAPQDTLDGTNFTFFKGINGQADGQGTVSVTVPKGLAAGNYRCCTMASASNHQPVLMGIAQRGFSDDCTKFTASNNGAGQVNAGSSSASAAAAQSTATGGGQNQGNKNGGAQNKAAQNQNANTPTTTAADAQATDVTAGSGFNATEQVQGASTHQHVHNRRRSRFAARELAV